MKVVEQSVYIPTINYYDINITFSISSGDFNDLLFCTVDSVTASFNFDAIIIRNNKFIVIFPL